MKTLKQLLQETATDYQKEPEYQETTVQRALNATKKWLTQKRQTTVISEYVTIYDKLLEELQE